jgi:hypothetical protein
MGENRSNHDRDVGLGNVTIDPHVDRRISQQSAGEFGDPIGTNGPHSGECLGEPEFMVEDLPSRISLLELAGLITKMPA